MDLETISKSLIVLGKLQEFSVPIHLDTGAQINAIKEEFFLKNFKNLENEIKEFPFQLRNASSNIILHKNTIQLQIKFGTCTWDENFIIIPNLPVDVLIGEPTMTNQKIDIINSKRHILIHSDKDKQIKLPYHEDKVKDDTDDLKRNKIGSTHALHLAEDLWLPPGCEILVNCIVSRSQKMDTPQTIIISSNTTPHPNLAIAKGIGEVKLSKTVCAIANLGLKVETLKKGAIMGICQIVPDDAYEVLELDQIKDNDSLKNNRLLNLMVQEINSIRGEDKTKPTVEQAQAMLKSYNLPPDLNIGVESLNMSQLRKLVQCLSKFINIFAVDPNNPGHIPPEIAEHTIDVQGHKPISQGPRRVSPKQRTIIKETIEKLLKSGIIKPSRSPWASPIVLVPKGEDDFRMAIDYRKLNEVTKSEIFAIPRIDDTIDALGGKIFFTTLDLASGYYQISVDPESRDKTAFISYEGQFEYNQMPFGLKNAPSTFQRVMQATLAGLTWKCCWVYLDDVIIASASFDEHINDLVSVLSRLKEAGFKLKSSKCNFACKEVKYLGHLISKDGVKANPKKIELIAEWGIPSTSANLHSFLGLAGYYRRLIKDFAAREAPLRALLKQDLKTFKMGPIEENAFKDLQNALMNDPIIALPDFSGNSVFELHTDASDLGVSAILCQIGPDKIERVIQYASRMLTAAELKYHTQHKEALAIIWGLNKFRPYLIGSPFVIRTDHHSLQWLQKADKGRLARWALTLSEFDFVIKHRPGIRNINADVASRWTKSPPEDEKDWDPIQNILHTGVVYNDIPVETTELCHNILMTQLIKHDLIKLIKDTQNQDKIVNNAIKDLKEDENAKVNELSTILNKKGVLKFCLDPNGLLYCKTRQRHKDQPKSQIIIPNNDKLIRAIMYEYHDNVLSGHLGVNKTLHKVQQKYFWNNMEKDCKQYIRSCDQCQRHKPNAPNPKNRPLNPSLPTNPNTIVAIDLIGPLPTSNRNHNKYAAVMVDNFTKWCVVTPLKNKEAGTVAEAIFTHWYCILGIPYAINTDQGSEFTNDLIKRLNMRMNVGYQTTTPFYPQPNGQVERMNQSLKECVATFVEDQPGSWDLYLPTVAFAFNTALHSSTGFTPFFLTFGREARQPMDILQGSYRDLKNDLDQYQLEMTVHLRRAHDIVRKKLEANAITMKKHWDSKIKHHYIFKKGDLVSMYHPKIHKENEESDHSQAWKSSWPGPYKVVKPAHKDNQDVYEILNESNGRVWTVNVHKLRPYTPRSFLSNKPACELPETPLMDDMSLDVNVPPPGTVEDALPMTVEQDEIIPIRNPPQEKLIVVPNNILVHRSAHRKKTGMSKQESLRINQRVLWENKNDEPTEINLIEYTVEKILGHKRNSNRIFYLVKWKNYDETSNTWEPINSFGKNLNQIKDYWETKQVKERPRMFRHLGQASSKKGEIVTSET